MSSPTVSVRFCLVLLERRGGLFGLPHKRVEGCQERGSLAIFAFLHSSIPFPVRTIHTGNGGFPCGAVLYLNSLERNSPARANLIAVVAVHEAGGV